ncbi:MAG: hypothetical protein NC930_03490 [Candidatus Omnitrophica bacterium]|nr:hypothetical protein [Candidatus Omnitrophota bacterium]
MRKVLVLAVALLVMAWAAGVRVHLGGMLRTLNLKSPEGYQRFDFKDGRSMIGKIVNKVDDLIEVDLGHETKVFVQSDIARVSDVEGPNLHEAIHTQGLKPSEEPWVTIRREDSVLAAAKTASGGARFFWEIKMRNWGRSFLKIGTNLRDWIRDLATALGNIAVKCVPKPVGVH